MTQSPGVSAEQPGDTAREAATDEAAAGESRCAAKKAAARSREAKKERRRPLWLTSRRPETDEAAASIVRNWLTLAGQPVTEQQVAKLAPHARPWQPAARRTAVALVAEGSTPAPGWVHERTRQRISGLHRQTPAEVVAITHLVPRAAEAAVWVADHHTHHGHGPTWAELADAFGLTGYGRRARNAAIAPSAATAG